MPRYRYEIEPRSRALGRGWRLRIWQRDPDGTEMEIGQGLFLYGTENNENAYTDARQFAEDWLSAHE